MPLKTWNYGEKLNKLRVAWGGRCVMCGAKHSRVRGRQAPLEFAHIKPTPIVPNGTGRGLRHRFLDIVKHPDCYVLICHKCHRILDA